MAISTLLLAQRVFDSSLDFISIVDLHYRYLEVNVTYERAYGIKRDQIVGMLVEDLLGKEIFHTTLKLNLDQCVAGHDVVDESWFLLPKLGKCYLSVTYLPLRSDDSEIEGVIVVARNETHRKHAQDAVMASEAQAALRNQNEELEREVQRRSMRIQELEQRRMQVEKLAALAQVAAGVAHEINNPLASISQAMLLVKQAVDPTHPHFEYVGKIDECISRMAKIVRQLYDLHRPYQPIVTQQNLVPIVTTAVDIMRVGAQKRQVHVQVSLPTEPIIVGCLSSELVQVLCNLIQNALDASAVGQQVEVGTTVYEDAVCISIADQGGGVSPDIADHIFEPFFTTKGLEEGHGLGLGLSVSRGLIETMGGMLDFTSNRDCGSLFSVRLPLR